MRARPRPKALQLLATVVTSVTIVATAYLWFGGYKFHVVETPSMSPSIPTGALALVRPVAIDEVAEGDVIAFTDPVQPGRIILHRVDDVSKDETGQPSLTTKGDANPGIDNFPVGGSELQGRSEFVIPRAGAVGRMFTEDWAPYALGGVPILFWLGNIARDWRRRRLVTSATATT